MLLDFTVEETKSRITRPFSRSSKQLYTVIIMIIIHDNNNETIKQWENYNNNDRDDNDNENETQRQWQGNRNN